MVRPRRQRQRQPSFSKDNPEFFKVFLPNTCSHEIVLSLFLDIVPIMLTLFYFKYFIEASVFYCSCFIIVSAIIVCICTKQ